MDIDIEKARAVKNRRERRWLSLTGVVAVGIGQTEDGRAAIMISVDQLTDQLTKRIPAEIDGVPIEITVTGAFRGSDNS